MYKGLILNLIEEGAIKIQKNIVAVDFGATKIRAALFKGNKIQKTIEKPTHADKGKAFILKQIFSTIQEVKGDNKINAIGLGSPGPLKDGIIKNPPNLPFRNFNLKSYLRNKFKVRVEVENDANCAALAEAKLGIKKKNFILLTLGSGIGGGIIINGQIYKGNGYAGELGNIIVDNGTYLEDLSSGKAIIKKSKKLFNKSIFLKDLSKLKNKKATNLVKEVETHLAEGIASLINIFDPEIVVLSGGFRNEGTLFINRIKKLTYKKVLIPSRPNIVWSKLKYPGIYGAYLLVK